MTIVWGSLKRRTAKSLLTGCAMIATVTAAYAQEQVAESGGEEAEKSGLDVIVVTAQKRSQDLQDVPVSVAVVSGSELTVLGVGSLDQMSAMVPNLQINRDTISDRISIRGIGSGEQAGFEQSVATFVDGVYRGRGVQSRFAFMDIESVEVLRGPQGTLFGKNTIAGALNIRTASPTRDFSAGVDLGYTPRFEEFTASGFVSGPLTDSVRMRLALQLRDQDKGWVVNGLSGDRYPDHTEWGGRISLEADLGPETLLRAKYEHGDWDTVGAPYEHIVAGPLAAVGVEDILDRRINQGSINPLTGQVDTVLDFGSIQQFSGKTDEANVQIEHGFGNGGTLTVVGSYSRYGFDRSIDADISPIALVRFDDSETMKQMTLEARYASDTGGKFEYLFGGFFLDSNLKADGLTLASIPTFYAITTAGCAAGNPLVDAGTAFACGTSSALQPLVGLIPGVGRYAVLDQDTRTWAVFGQATARLSDSVRVTGGIRYTSESKQASQAALATYSSTIRSPTADLIAAAVAQQLLEFTAHNFSGLQRKENSITWSANIQYDATKDVMLYAQASTGFKAGGFNSFFTGRTSGLGASAADVDFEEERARTYEIGAKTRILDGRAELNVAAFYTKYSNMQVAVFSGNTTFNVENAADADTRGIELDTRWKLSDRLSLSVAAAYTDFSFKRFPNQACTNAQFLAYRQALFAGSLGPAAAALTAADCAAASVNDLEGRTTVDAPKLSASTRLNLDQPIGSYKLNATLEYSYSSSVYRQGDLDPILKTGDTHILNVVLRFGPEDGPWNLGVRLNNVLGNDEFTSGNDIPISFGSHFIQVPRPRSATFTAGLKF